MEHDKGKELFLDLLNSGMMIAENVDESLNEYFFDEEMIET
mgnify:CR=1 FL=1